MPPVWMWAHPSATFFSIILLAAKKPRQMIIVDAAQCEGKRPGEVFEIDIDEINPKKDQ
jgi:Ni,Fe-hydrogenase maturation factor